MKIQITENIDKVIEGYTTIPIIYGEIDLNHIPDNAASIIIAIDALDSIKQEKIEQFIFNICKKLRLNSTITLGGLDVYALSRNLISGHINVIMYNKIISGKNGIYSAKYIIDLLQKNNIKIQSAIFKENYYEITASRTNN